MHPRGVVAVEDLQRGDVKTDQAGERDPTTSITHLSLEWNPQGARREGIPKNSWRKTVEKEHEDLGTTWNQVKRAETKQWPLESCSGGPMLRSK